MTRRAVLLVLLAAPLLASRAPATSGATTPAVDLWLTLLHGNDAESRLVDAGRLDATGRVTVPGAPTLDLATIDFLGRVGDEWASDRGAFVTLGITSPQALSCHVTGTLAGRVPAATHPPGGAGRIVRLDAEPARRTQP